MIKQKNSRGKFLYSVIIGAAIFGGIFIFISAFYIKYIGIDAIIKKENAKMRRDFQAADSLFEQKKYKEAESAYFKIAQQAENIRKNHLGLSDGSSITNDDQKKHSIRRSTYIRQFAEHEENAILRAAGAKMEILFEDYAMSRTIPDAEIQPLLNLIQKAENITKSTSSVPFFLRGRIYARQQKPLMAIQEFQEVIKQKPPINRIVAAYNEIGLAYIMLFRQGQINARENAIQAFKSALNHDDKSQDSWYNLASVYASDASKKQEAIEAYRRFLQLVPPDSQCARDANDAIIQLSK